VINFGDFPLRRDDLGASWADADEQRREQWMRIGIVPLDYADSVAADYPDLLEIVRQKVMPIRLTDNRELYRRHWWQYAEKRVDLYSATRKLERVLAINCGATPHMSFCFLSSNHVFANTLAIVSLDSFGAFAVLQSRIHEIWARFMASSMKDDLRYTPSDCFEPFPFPQGFESSSDLGQVGSAYHDVRSQLMQIQNKGLTAIYNWFHDPECENPGIVRLRELHHTVDQTVLDVYGWSDIHPSCEFIPEFEDEGEEEENGRHHKEKYRFRWPDEIRDEVLARLVNLNRERALEEGLTVAGEVVAASSASAKPKKTGNKNRKSKKAIQDKAATLFAVGPEEA
jgi:hypothetical protein